MNFNQMEHLVKLNKQKNIFGQNDHWVSNQIKHLIKLNKQNDILPMYLGTIIATYLYT
jgi:hypothetical protein